MAKGNPTLAGDLHFALIRYHSSSHLLEIYVECWGPLPWVTFACSIEEGGTSNGNVDTKFRSLPCQGLDIIMVNYAVAGNKVC
jgi:hypothetical protein